MCHLQKLCLPIVFFVVTLLLPTGCMSPGQGLSPSAIEQLRSGQTHEEVRRVFGTPKQSFTGSNGKQLDVFRVFLPKGNRTVGAIRIVEVRSLHVLYDPQDRVEKFMPHVGELTGFVGLDNNWKSSVVLDAAKVSTIKRGVTSRMELIQSFGPATIEGLDVAGNPCLIWLFLAGHGLNMDHGRELFVQLDGYSLVGDYSLREVQR